MKKLTVFLGFLFLMVAGTAQASMADQAGHYVQKLGDKAITTLSRNGITQSEIEKEFYTILEQYFDVSTIGKFVLGAHWKKASEAERQEFMQLFKTMIVKIYSGRFTSYKDEKFKVINSVAKNKKDSIVTSNIVFADERPPLKLEWRVRQTGDSFKVIDLMVEGVSMSITQRGEFDSVIQNNGGQVEALLATMRKNYQ